MNIHHSEHEQISIDHWRVRVFTDATEQPSFAITCMAGSGSGVWHIMTYEGVFLPYSIRFLADVIDYAPVKFAPEPHPVHVKFDTGVSIETAHYAHVTFDTLRAHVRAFVLDGRAVIESAMCGDSDVLHKLGPDQEQRIEREAIQAAARKLNEDGVTEAQIEECLSRR